MGTVLCSHGEERSSSQVIIESSVCCCCQEGKDSAAYLLVARNKHDTTRWESRSSSWRIPCSVPFCRLVCHRRWLMASRLKDDAKKITREKRLIFFKTIHKKIINNGPSCWEVSKEVLEPPIFFFFYSFGYQTIHPVLFFSFFHSVRGEKRDTTTSLFSPLSYTFLLLPWELNTISYRIT